MALSYALDLERYKYFDSEFPDYDILSAIRFSMMTGIQYRTTHVKGHQDLMEGPLDIFAVLNIKADSLANI